MTIVKLKSSNEEYVLIGSGFGMFKAKGQRSNLSWNTVEEGDKRVLALSDKYGEIYWAESSDVAVVSVDGVSIYDILDK